MPSRIRAPEPAVWPFPSWRFPPCKLSRIALAAGVAASTVHAGQAGPAAAHVSVQPVGEAAKGGYVTLNLQGPERARPGIDPKKQ
ncbi:hypothetical protein SCALM49S_02705 [Streptomyces californicus]